MSQPLAHWHGCIGMAALVPRPQSGARMLNSAQPACCLMSSRKPCSLQTMAGVATPVAVLRDLPAAVRVGPSLSLSVRIQRVVAAVEEAAKDVRLVTLAQTIAPVYAQTSIESEVLAISIYGLRLLVQSRT